MKKTKAWVWVLLCILPFAAALFALCIGRLSISPAEVLSSAVANITGGETATQYIELTLWKVRLPRILLALAVGAGLSVSGCVFQSLFSNPLATPDTLGVASGASFGAALALLLGFKLIGVQFISLIFGGAAVVLTVLAGSSRESKGLNNTVLAGIMIGSLFNALISLVKFSADTEDELPAITYWLMGNLSAASYASLLVGAVPIIICIAVLFALRWRLNLLSLSYEEARATGVNIKALRAVTVACATVMTASSVSMCGQVGWIGLLVPHICRMGLGNDHTRLIPASALGGAAFLVLVDTAARSISATELPISVLTAIIGAPFFIYLMRRTRGWRL